MADIVLNFAVPDGATAPRRTVHKGGKWTQRVKAKRTAKLTAHRTRPVEAAPGEEPRTQDEGPADDRASETKKGKEKAKEERKLFVSSLFSAEPLPAPRTAAGPSVVHAPSNAALASTSVGAADYGLDPRIAAHLQSERMGITAPTGIQALAWPRLLREHRDVVMQSQTGSGKTLAYLVPIIQDLLTLPAFLHADPKQWQRDVGTLAVVLVPTRELAEQVAETATGLLRLQQTHWIVTGVLHGGTNRTHEKARARKGLPLLICTPGRLLDHLEKTTSLRLAGGPLPSHEATEDRLPESIRSQLCLRWLVVDEADRLMDLGFEEQMKGIVRHLDEREAQARRFWASRKTPCGPRPDRRTVLCSATMPQGVQELVGIALKDPVMLQGDTRTDDFSAPAQLSQRCVVMPPKLRFVALVALLRHLFIVGKRASKALVFLSCTDSVDFHFEALGGLAMGRDASPVEVGDEAIDRRCALLPEVRLFRLHGSLDIQTRLKSLRTFSQLDDDSPAVLFCTSVASRGLDVPFVSHVIQCDLPTEGGIKEYLHRVGRTARAGNAGEAWSFLLPSEEGWIDQCRSEQRDVGLDQEAVDDLLRNGFSGKAKEWETRATDVQMAAERWVLAATKNTSLARRAFASHVRAYATHPADEKRFFHVKNLHLGHLAKAFGLREAPTDLVVAKSVSGTKRPKDQGFEALAKKRKTSNTLRGLVKNTADEFNVGNVAELEALVRRAR